MVRVVQVRNAINQRLDFGKPLFHVGNACLNLGMSMGLDLGALRREGGEADQRQQRRDNDPTNPRHLSVGHFTRSRLTPRTFS